MERLAAVDAQTFWMSNKIPNDQFVLYAFDGVLDQPSATIERLSERARACPDLGLRIVDDCAVRYPRWVRDSVSPGQFQLHNGGSLDWADCMDEVARLADAQLDPRAGAWRLHLLGPVTGGPVGTSALTVAVLQVSHALADGLRTAQLAGWLFGRPEPVPPLIAERPGSMLRCGIAAARAERALTADIEAGRLPAPAPPRPVLPTNTCPTGPRRLRTLVRDRTALIRNATVTVSALLAVGTALADQLRARGVDPALLGAEVPMAKPGIRHSRNHFRNVGVGLYPDLSTEERARLIAAELRGAQLRAAHPAAAASSAALAATPAALLRWGVAQFDASVRAPMVTGNTVVSSVNRGPADLRIDDAPVVLTASYPALSPMMGLTHGVHGIGDTIAISVHAADSALTEDELDDYVERLGRALG